MEIRKFVVEIVVGGEGADTIARETLTTLRSIEHVLEANFKDSGTLISCDEMEVMEILLEGYQKKYSEDECKKRILNYIETFVANKSFPVLISKSLPEHIYSLIC